MPSRVKKLAHNNILTIFLALSLGLHILVYELLSHQEPIKPAIKGSEKQIIVLSNSFLEPPKEVKKELKKTVEKPKTKIIKKKKVVKKKPVIKKKKTVVKKEKSIIKKQEKIVEEPPIIEEEKTTEKEAIETKPTVETSPPKQKIVLKKDDGVENYLSQVKKQLQENLIYPRRALKLRIEGVGKYRFFISKSGDLINEVEIITSSGSSLLDRAAIETIEESLPFEVPPLEGMEIVVPIEFRIGS